MPQSRGFTLVELLVVIVIIGIVIALLLPARPIGMCSGREASARALISNLSIALAMYERDREKYPETATNFSSEPVYKALGTTDQRPGIKYYEFMPHIVCQETTKHILNPVYPRSSPEETLYYQNNGPGAVPAPVDPRNKLRFDLWMRGCRTPAGIPSPKTVAMGAQPPISNWD